MNMAFSTAELDELKQIIRDWLAEPVIDMFVRCEKLQLPCPN
jgi:hypothetical protein